MSPRQARSAVELAWVRSASSDDQDWATLRRRLAQQPAAPSVDLCFVRHGETTTNARGLVTGMTDAPLTDRGRMQATAAGEDLSGTHFDLAFSSQLQRSRETLELIVESGRLQVGAMIQDWRLAERSLGEMELTEMRRIDAYAQGDLGFAPGGGDSYATVLRRCLSFLLDVRVVAAALRRPLALLICTHLGPLRVFAGILDQMTDPAEVLALDFANSRPTLFRLDRLAFPPFALSVSASVGG